MNTAKQLTCKQRVRKNLRSRLGDFKQLFYQMESDRDDVRETAAQDFSEYGLSFDYVAPNTFQDQPEGYARYQISWGGPSDEFRFFINPDRSCHRIEYWFMDWYDGAHVNLSGADLELMQRVYDDFNECGTVENAVLTALEG